MILPKKQNWDAFWARNLTFYFSIFHSVLFHRSFGKFTYQDDSSYIIGTIGYEDVDCDYIGGKVLGDHLKHSQKWGCPQLLTKRLWNADSSLQLFLGYTYVRAQSSELDRKLKQDLALFTHELRNSTGAGTVSLEFYQKKRHRWSLWPESIPWEVWTIRCDLVQLNNEQQRIQWQEKVGEMLSDKVSKRMLSQIDQCGPMKRCVFHSSGFVHSRGDEPARLRPQDA